MNLQKQAPVRLSYFSMPKKKNRKRGGGWLEVETKPKIPFNCLLWQVPSMFLFLSK